MDMSSWKVIEQSRSTSRRFAELLAVMPFALNTHVTQIKEQRKLYIGRSCQHYCQYCEAIYVGGTQGVMYLSARKRTLCGLFPTCGKICRVGILPDGDTVPIHARVLVSLHTAREPRYFLVSPVRSPFPNFANQSCKLSHSSSYLLF